MNMDKASATAERTLNGIDLDFLFGTIEQIKEQPEVGQFQFRAENEWVDGAHNRATVGSFYGALREDDTREPMEFELDEPPVLGGRNLGANPVEYLLVALSGCLTTTMISHAAAHGLEVRGVQSRYEGDLDLRGYLGISDDVPVGYQNIRVYFRIDADLTRDQKLELVRMAQKFSPVFNSLTSPVPVSVELDET